MYYKHWECVQSDNFDRNSAAINLSPCGACWHLFSLTEALLASISSSASAMSRPGLRKVPRTIFKEK